jgi:YVTN family beta-propeller protein
VALAWPAGAGAESMRDVVLVGNAAGGTVTFLDGRTWQNLGSVTVVPGSLALSQQLFAPVFNQAEGGARYVDDAIASPDGRTLYVSRANLGDVAAFDLETHQLLWTQSCLGFRCDHMALSPDGSRLVVSATLAEQDMVLDTGNGAVVGSFLTGTFPHQNDYSADGRYIYNESIGIVPLPHALEALKGYRQLTIADAATLQVVRTYQLPHGLRPTVYLPGGLAYMDLSYLNGFVQFDLNTGTIVRTVEQPFSPAAAAEGPDSYPLNSAHHGIAVSGDQTKLCDAGTIDNYVAIVSLPGLTTDRYTGVGREPYWALTSADGNYCLVSNSMDNNVSVIDYRTAQEVARVPVGYYPQRERLASVPESVIANLTPPPYAEPVPTPPVASSARICTALVRVRVSSGRAVVRHLVVRVDGRAVHVGRVRRGIAVLSLRSAAGTPVTVLVNARTSRGRYVSTRRYLPCAA